MGIHSIEVPKQSWTSFLQDLNRLAQDRPVRLEVINRELGDEEMASKLPLVAIDFETKGSERGDFLVTLMSDDGPLTHRIEKPTQLYVAHDEAGGLLQTLAVLEAGGGETIIYFEEVPALPEQTDAHALS
jgi:hypothetical protein